MKIDHCTALVQLLKDAGCNPEIIHQFLSAMEKGRTEENLHPQGSEAARCPGLSDLYSQKS